MNGIFSWITQLSPVEQSLIATLFTWTLTALGASLVFFFKKVNRTFMDAMLGFAAGVMIAASFWSLLDPSIEMAHNLKINAWIVTSLGFIFGGLLLFIGDKFYNKINKNKNSKELNKLKRAFMLMFSITLHNIPEGLAIGVAFGSVVYELEGATLIGAWVLALGIGLQNFPEGSAVSLPLRRDGMSRLKSFFYGQLSAVVEPIAALIGAILITKIQILLPFLLSFAAGAMIYVVVQELIPESQTNQRKDLMAIFTLVGFSLMMILDVALG